MSSSIKSIFKILILVAIIPVIACAGIEWFNVYSNSYKLKPLINISIDQAAKMFSEESFCLGGNLEDLFPTLRGKDTPETPEARLTCIDKLFGGYTAPTDIYDYLMNDSPTSIKDFAFNTHGDIVDENGTRVYNADAPAGIFQNLGLIVDETSPIGEVYRENLATPMNLGIPYLNDGTIKVMASWNMAQLLNTDGKSADLSVSSHMKTTLQNMIYDDGVDDDDDDGIDAADVGASCFMRWNGYRVYMTDLQVKVTYELLNMSTSEGGERFEELTHVSRKVFDSSHLMSGANEKYAVVAKIHYSVPIAYEGVTPWRKYYQWIFNGAWGEGHKAGGRTGFQNAMQGTAYTPAAATMTDDLSIRTTSLEGDVIHYIVR